MANSRDRRNHEDAINDTADAPASGRPPSDHEGLNSTATRRGNDDQWKMRRDGDFAGHCQDGLPVQLLCYRTVLPDVQCISTLSLKLLLLLHHAVNNLL